MGSTTTFINAVEADKLALNATELRTILRSLFTELILENFETYHGRVYQHLECCGYHTESEPCKSCMILAETRVDLIYLRDLFEETARCMFLQPHLIDFETCIAEFKDWNERTDFTDLTTFVWESKTFLKAKAFAIFTLRNRFVEYDKTADENRIEDEEEMDI